MKITNSLFLSLLSFLLLVSCKEEEAVGETAAEVETIISDVSSEYAPDSRVALFDVAAEERDGTYVLEGTSNLPEAVAELKKKLTEAGIEFSDRTELLPAKNLEDKTFALVKNSVANLRSNPGHSSELSTQATLGTPLKVLQKEDNWYLVQSPDQYLAWVDSGGISLRSKEELETWRAADKVIFTEVSGHSYSEPDADSQRVSDVVAGNVFELAGVKGDFYEVIYPDGRKAFILREEAEPYSEWLGDLEQTEEQLVATAKEMMGAPYLWGGTSTKGVDCSGFTKTVYFLNGTVIPRDASQQVHTGKLIDSVKNFENHRPGDLLFFGRKATDSTSERVVHVGMWIGDNKFIHSMGDVHVSTFDKNHPDFDQYNYNRYLRTKRILGEQDKQLVNLEDSELFLANPES